MIQPLFPLVGWSMFHYYSFLFIAEFFLSWVFVILTIDVAPKKTGTVDFSGLCSDQLLLFITLLDRASFPHNNTKIIIFYE